MADFSKRSEDIEIMDDLTSSGEIIDQTLRELEVINKWLGGNAVTLNALAKLKRKAKLPEKLIIADLGCGGGDMLNLVSQWAERNKIAVELIGIDANPNIVEYARKHVPLKNVQFKALDIFSEEFRAMKFDVVMATLFFHHFTHDHLTEVFRQLKNQVNIAVIINDIHRHPLAFYSIGLLTRTFSKSSMVIHDAPLSVLRAFSKSELEKIFQDAGFSSYSLKWKWAFRWQAILYPTVC
jgi:2-polyprenyl-3-methyl-5-hydroxy-6-metoxy-1,4-benzoquinol methylase